MSEKSCSHHHHHHHRHKLLRRWCAAILIIFFVILVVVLIVFAVLQPKKPQFTVQDATVFVLNATAPNAVSTTIQVTIAARNPNSRLGIYYDGLAVFATYTDQQITTFTALPPTYQGPGGATVWSPFVYGTNVPVAPFIGLQLQQDSSHGGVRIKFQINGRVRWKVGAVVTGRFLLHVSCPAYISSLNSGGIVVNDGVKYQLSTRCSVSV